MSNNAAFGYLNFLTTIGTAGISDNGSAAGMGSANLAGPTQYPPWQSVHPATCILSYDAGAAVNWDAVCFFGTNWTLSATISIAIGTTAGASDVYAGPIVNAGIVPGYRQSVNILPGTQTGRFARIVVRDASNTDGFLQAGLAYFGPLWIPSRNFAYGEAAGWQDPSVVQQSKGGQKYFDQRPSFRQNSFKFENLGKSELWASALEIDRTCGVQGNLLYIPEPNGAMMMQESIFGSLTELDMPSRTNFARYSKAYAIQERL